MYRFALRPGWLVGHLVCAVLVYVMIRLGLWQIGVSEHQHFNIHNFGYAIQWWLFAGFTPFMWGRIMRDHARRVLRASLVYLPGLLALLLLDGLSSPAALALWP